MSGMKNGKNKKRTTIRLSEGSDRKVDIIKGKLLADHGKSYSRDDIIDHIIDVADRRTVIDALNVKAS